MTRDRNFKKLVRARMRTTGESYTAALAHFLHRAQRQPAPPPPPVPPAQRDSGGPAMYPFERFTERAKRVLTLAQQEAEASGQSYIGTEHLLLGLLAERDGLAAHVLSALGVELEPARTALSSVLRSMEPQLPTHIIPTSRVKKIIEISFEEARELGHSYVGTEHLLLGILIEGEGIAAKLLTTDFGVTLEKARGEILRRLELGYTEPALPASLRSMSSMSRPPLSPVLSGLLRRAGAEAAAAGTHLVGLEHLLRAMIGAAATVALERHLEVMRTHTQIEEAIRAQDFDKAAQLREGHRSAEEALKRAVDAWKEDLQ